VGVGPRPASGVGAFARPQNKELKLTKPSIMKLRSLTLCSTDLTGDVHDRRAADDKAVAG
jgi:hypothetical protein